MAYVHSIFSIEGKVALITGAGKGIGKAIAKGYAEAGANLILCGRTIESLEQTKQEIEQSANVKILTLTCDINSEEAVQNMVQTAMEHFGRIDILVNNAGTASKKIFWETTVDEWDAMVDTNLRGQFLVAKAVAPVMIEQRSGKIINLASIASFGATEKGAVYGATKGGVLMMTKGMAIDLAPYGVFVNALAPGVVDTGIYQDPEVRDKVYTGVLQKQLVPELIKPEDMVGPAIFLASDASNQICGASLLVDGGLLAINYRIPNV